MLATNTGTLHEDERLVVSAVVTDPDGVDDLIGGTLLDPGSGAAYGAFATSAAEGSYEIDLGWGELGTVSAIDAPPAGASRRLLARFFDVAGHRAEAEVTVTLRCDDAGYSACDGQCFDLERDEDHCGTCDLETPPGVACIGGEPGCIESFETLCGDSCHDLSWEYDNCGDCGNDCGVFSADHDVDGWCRGGVCTTVLQEYELISTSCSAICGAFGLTCETTTVDDDFYCPGGGGVGVGCAYFTTLSCGHTTTITSCGASIAITWAPEPGWCDYPEPYTREHVNCYCRE
jgi:hypothetical protein